MIQTFSSSTSAANLPLVLRNEYTLLNVDSTDSIYIAVNGATPDGAAGADKFVLSPGTLVVIGPGDKSLHFKSSANTPKLCLSAIVCTASVLAANGVN